MRERESVHMQGRCREKGRERKFQASSAKSAQSLSGGSSSWTMRSWHEPKPRVRCLTDWGAPLLLFFKISLWIHTFTCICWVSIHWNSYLYWISDCLHLWSAGGSSIWFLNPFDMSLLVFGCFLFGYINMFQA